MIHFKIGIVLIALALIGLQYLMHKYFSDEIALLHGAIDYNEENGRFGLDCEKNEINKRIDTLSEKLNNYVQTSHTHTYDLEIHKLRDAMQNNQVCSENGLYKVSRDISNLQVEHGNLFAKIDEILEKLTKKVERHDSLVEINCCKSHMKKLNQDAFKFDTRLIRIEEKLFSFESTNQAGERVISVVVPNLEDVPCATGPLGNSGVDVVSTDHFYVKREREALKQTKLNPE